MLSLLGCTVALAAALCSSSTVDGLTLGGHKYSVTADKRQAQDLVSSTHRSRDPWSNLQYPFSLRHRDILI